MTSPRWILEPIEAFELTDDLMQLLGTTGGPYVMLPATAERLVAAIIEHLPLEEMAEHMAKALELNGYKWEASRPAMYGVVDALTNGNSEVMQLAELYQGACKALDEAGVPYALDLAADGKETPLHLAGRIRWLAQQRPIRAELEAVEATRDGAIKLAADRSEELARITAERDHTRLMHEGAAADLDAERKRHQATIDEFAKGELELIGRAERAEADAIHARALAEVIGQRDARIKALEAENTRILGQLAQASDMNGKLAERGAELETENEQLREEAKQALEQRDTARLLSAQRLQELDSERARCEELTRQLNVATNEAAALRQRSNERAGVIANLAKARASKPRGKLPAKLRGKKAVRR